MPNDVPDWSQLVSLGQGPVSFASVTVTGILGAANTTRWVGAVSGASPTGGPYNQGDWATDLIGGFWTCSSGGSPGTWLWSPALTSAGDLILPSSGRGSGAIQGTSLKALSDTNPQMTLDTVSTGKQGVLGFRSAGAAKWDIFKQTDDALHILDRVSGRDWLIVTTGDVATLAGPLSIPPSVGGTVAPTSYGTLAVKAFEKSGALATYDFTSIPTGFRNARLRYHLRNNSAGTSVVTDAGTFNGDTTANYNQENAIINTALTVAENLAQGSLPLSESASGGQAAGQYADGETLIFSYADTTSRKAYTKHGNRTGGDLANQNAITFGSGHWKSTAAINEITLTPGAGTGYDANSWAVLILEP